MEQFKVELPKEVTDAIKVEVLNTLDGVSDSDYERSVLIMYEEDN